MTKSNDDTRNRSTSIRDQLRGHTGRNDLTRPLCPYGARGERVAEFYEFFAGGGELALAHRGHACLRMISIPKKQPATPPTGVSGN
jgi:hypothetical protein